ncbi:MAG TPA: DUF3306 domain-containing protein [Ramlibacter sp.]|nr:DUF3306 domain-containing protein [Ramlibacter sp.]
MSDDGFLRRWSRRKLEVKQGRAVESQPQPEPPPRPAAADPSHAIASADPVTQAAPAGQLQEPPLTLEDVKSLTPDSDYTRFAAADVAPEVKNAAMKKLFADPRYNVMDGMDVYTGDYSRPDPVPPAMLRQLASARFLGLFDQEERQGQAAREARDVADNPIVQSVAKSEPVPPAVSEPLQNADPDLRLQQDHAAPGKDPERGSG